MIYLSDIIKPIILYKQIIFVANNTDSNFKEKSDTFNSNKNLDNDDELEESDDGVSKDIEGEGRVSSHPPLTHLSPTLTIAKNYIQQRM